MPAIKKHIKNPLAKFKSKSKDTPKPNTCASCGNARPKALNVCAGCQQPLHNTARCKRQNMPLWLIEPDPSISTIATICHNCHGQLSATWQWLRQQGITVAINDTNALDRAKVRDFLAKRYERELQKGPRLFSDTDFTNLDVARRTVKRITDLVYGHHRIVFERPDAIPYNNLALRELHLPDVFTHQRAKGYTKTALMDILIGLALHEAGHGEYTTLAASKSVQTVRVPSTKTMWLFNKLHYPKITDDYVAKHKDKHPETANKWSIETAAQTNVNRGVLHILWNLVEDMYLEYRLRLRFPGWDSYLHAAYRWVWTDAVRYLEDTLKQTPNPESSLAIRTAVTTWHILAPEKFDTQVPEALIKLAEKARSLAVERLVNDELHTDDAKIQTAIDLYKLLTEGCTFDQPPTGENNGTQSHETDSQPGGTDFSDPDKQNTGSQPGSKKDSGDPDSSTDRSGGTGQDSEMDSEPGAVDGNTEADSTATGRDKQADTEASGLHTDDYGWDGQDHGTSEHNDTGPQQGFGHGAGAGGGEDIDKHKDDHLDQIGPVSNIKAPATRQEHQLLQLLLNADTNAKERHIAQRIASKNYEIPVEWVDEQELDERHRSAYAQRKSRLEPIINRLRKNLQVRNVRSDTKTGGYRSGRLHRRTLYQVITNNNINVFYKKTDKNLPKIRIGLLIDESGSMGSVAVKHTPAAIARDTSAVLAEGFQGIRDVKLWVTGYSTAYRHGTHSNAIQVYVDPTRKKFEALEREIMGGGTPTGECMWKLAREMYHGLAWDEQAFMFVITDGGYGTGLTPEHVVSLYPKITFIEVLIGSTTPMPGMHYSIPVKDVNDFTDTMVRTISHILLGGDA